MKLFTILLISMILNGCSGMLISSATREHILSSDEIDAYNRVGSAVSGCITAAGPPPAGSTTWIIHPKDDNVRINFTDGCHIK
jgi:hypothetical protein